MVYVSDLLAIENSLGGAIWTFRVLMGGRTVGKDPQLGKDTQSVKDTQ